MRGHLLDVNVLLALAWPNHQFHAQARMWFDANAAGGWWTCAATELGFVRLSSNPAYTEHAKSPLEATLLLRSMTQHPQHRFAEALPPLSTAAYEGIATRIQGHRQVTDAYLLVVAQHHRLHLLTTDRRVVAYAPSPEILAILPMRGGAS